MVAEAGAKARKHAKRLAAQQQACAGAALKGEPA